jgi:cytochrome b6-f complex iron-sulfur subunit
MGHDKKKADDAQSITRRVFFKSGVGVVGACYAGAVAYPIYRYLATPAKQSAGTALRFAFGTRPALLIHLDDDSFVCFDAVCTHLGCTVEFQPDLKRIHCACHGGTYDIATGKNVAGPPPKPLNKYQVEVADGQVVITRA